MPLQTGTLLGPYEIQSSIAAGMGEVYRARDTRLDRTVAIKVLPAALSMDPEFRVLVSTPASDPVAVPLVVIQNWLAALRK